MENTKQLIGQDVRVTLSTNNTVIEGKVLDIWLLPKKLFKVQTSPGVIFKIEDKIIKKIEIKNKDEIIYVDTD